MRQFACISYSLWLFASVAHSAQLSKNESVQLRLRQRVSITWQNQTLLQAIHRLESSQGIQIWLDRRVDPNQEVHLQLRNETLGDAFNQLADSMKLGVTLLDEILYIGPQHSAAYLEERNSQIRNQLEQVSSKTKRKWLKKEISHWPKLTEPRKYLNELLLQQGFQVKGIENIPHDLWRAQELPKLTLLDRSLLILVGFDLTIELERSGTVCSIVPIESPKSYKSKPQSLTNSPVTNPRKSKEVFTLRIKEHPLGAVLDHLSQELSLRFTWHPSISAQKSSWRKKFTSCDVTNAELDVLLTNLLRPAGLSHQRKGKTIILRKLEESSP